MNEASEKKDYYALTHEERLTAVERLTDRGYSAQQIANILGCGYSTIKILKTVLYDCGRLKLKNPCKDKLSTRNDYLKRIEKVKNFLENGLSTKEIAQKLCISERSARHYIRKVFLKSKEYDKLRYKKRSHVGEYAQDGQYRKSKKSTKKDTLQALLCFDVGIGSLILQLAAELKKDRSFPEVAHALGLTVQDLNDIVEFFREKAVLREQYKKLKIDGKAVRGMLEILKQSATRKNPHDIEVLKAEAERINVWHDGAIMIPVCPARY